MSIGNIILENLTHNETYIRKVLPFLKKDYFEELHEQEIFEVIAKFYEKYNHVPSKEEVTVEISKLNVTQQTFDSSCEYVSEFTAKEYQIDWLVDETEKFCQERATYNALKTAIAIADGADKTFSKGAIPDILRDALAVSFNTSVGHDYMNDHEKRYELYHSPQRKVAFDLSLFNTITKGGVSRKTLTVIMAATGVGKSLFMCHSAVANMKAGYNVLYITLEMGEAGDPSISERIDSNLLDIRIDDLLGLPYKNYMNKFLKAKENLKGRLFVKEYPTSSANTLMFKSYLNELKIKKNFVPDIIYVDYLNICASSKLKMGSNVNTYSYIKSIAEELRALAIEYDVPVVTATQTNRGGYNNSEIELDNTSESIGLPMTVDFMFALSQPGELKSLNQILVKQLKNRYTNPDINNKFVIGCDKSKMRLYEVEQSAQEGLSQDIDSPVMDKSRSHEVLIEEAKAQLFKGKKKKKTAFEGIK